MAARPYEVTVTPPSYTGHGWSIEVDGETIAADQALTHRSPIEAFWAAKEWARLHDQLGYEMRARWWEVAEAPAPTRPTPCAACGAR